MDGTSWRNLHWLPHQVLVYEVRVPEGYGMRWSQDRSKITKTGIPSEVTDGPHDDEASIEGLSHGTADSPALESATAVEHEDSRPWIFRGFVEPMMENGHEIGWRH
jgi:hypothetical protein